MQQAGRVGRPAGCPCLGRVCCRRVLSRLCWPSCDGPSIILEPWGGWRRNGPSFLPPPFTVFAHQVSEPSGGASPICFVPGGHDGAVLHAASAAAASINCTIRSFTLHCWRVSCSGRSGLPSSIPWACFHITLEHTHAECYNTTCTC